MSEFLSAAYPWIKSLHVISVIAWMAGLFYLPRLFVYHVERTDQTGALHETFVVMEHKLYRYIMNPAMVAVWVFGGTLISTPGIVDWSSGWSWTKAVAVSLMTLFHHWLGRRRKELAAGTNTTAGRTYRLMNEVPTLLMVVIVVMIIARPF